MKTILRRLCGFLAIVLVYAGSIYVIPSPNRFDSIDRPTFVSETYYVFYFPFRLATGTYRKAYSGVFTGFDSAKSEFQMNTLGAGITVKFRAKDEPQIRSLSKGAQVTVFVECRPEPSTALSKNHLITISPKPNDA